MLGDCSRIPLCQRKVWEVMEGPAFNSTEKDNRWRMKESWVTVGRSDTWLLCTCARLLPVSTEESFLDVTWIDLKKSSNFLKHECCVSPYLSLCNWQLNLPSKENVSVGSRKWRMERGEMENCIIRWKDSMTPLGLAQVNEPLKKVLQSPLFHHCSPTSAAPALKELQCVLEETFCTLTWLLRVTLFVYTWLLMYDVGTSIFRVLRLPNLLHSKCQHWGKHFFAISDH